jgi:AcrR family transcriptional regulator
MQEADGRRQRWAGHRQARRAELVAAAVEAVRTHGTDTGLDQVAAQAGVSKPVLYRHFTDRADLFAAVLDAIADDVLMPRIAAELAGVPGRPAPSVTDAAAVGRVVRAFVSVVDNEPQLYRFALAHASSGRGGNFVATTERRVAQLLSSLLGDRLRELGADSGGAEVWAFGVVGMVQLATQRWFEQRTMSADALVAYLTALVTGGLSGVLGVPEARGAR